MSSQAGVTDVRDGVRSHRQDPKRLAEIELWRGDLRVLLRIIQDSETPWFASALMAGVLLWGAIPVDPLPDFIPLAGILDDVTVFLIVRAAIYRLIPDDIIDYHTEVVAEKSRFRFGPTRAVASLTIVQIIVIVAILGTVTTILF